MKYNYTFIIVKLYFTVNYFNRKDVIFLATFGERLKYLRKKEKLRADDIAAWIGVTRRSIFLYEKNEAKPSYEILTALADFFFVSIDYLIGRSDDSNQEYYLNKATEELMNKLPPSQSLMFQLHSMNKSDLPNVIRKFRLLDDIDKRDEENGRND